MIYVLDTNAWSDAMRGVGQVGRKLSVVPMVRVRLAAPALYELRRGASADRTRLGKAVDLLAATYEIAPFDAKSAEEAAGIAVELKARGRKIHHLDALIAGIAKAHDAVLVTRDRDFEGIAGLVLENWA